MDRNTVYAIIPLPIKYDRSSGMETFNKLLVYKDSYEYLQSLEVLYILPGRDNWYATHTYSRIIKDLLINGDDKWALDIALDCIRNFTDDEIAFIEKNKAIREYHHGYGLYVRNKYVYPSRFHACYCADKLSSLVHKFIIAIICKDEDPFDKKVNEPRIAN